jgi:hypothetical protein
MDLVTLANSVGLSAPLTVIAIAVLHALHAGPPFVETIAGSQPWVIAGPTVGAAVILFVFEVLASKSKLSKPAKHIYDVVQSVIKPFAVALFSISMLQSTTTHLALAPGASDPIYASVIGVGQFAHVNLDPMRWFAVALAATVALFVHSVRSMADFAATLVPIPFLDAAVSFVADAYAIVMMLLLVFAPTAAAVICVVQLLACILVAGWLYRVCSLFVRLVVAAWFPVRKEQPQAAPRDVREDAGARTIIRTWIERGRSWPKFSTVFLYREATVLHIVGRKRWRRYRAAVDLRRIRWAAIEDGLLADTLTLHAGEGSTPTFCFGFVKNDPDARRSLESELRDAGVAVDDPNGERLPASLRTRSA